MRRKLISIGAGAAGLALLVTLLWFFVLTSPSSRVLGEAVGYWRELVEPAGVGRGPVVSGELTVVRAGGLPEELAGRSATFVYQWPDRLRVRVEVEGIAHYLARHGDEIRISVPHRDMYLLGTAEAARFFGRPETREALEMPALGFPLSGLRTGLLPAAVQADQARGEDTTTVTATLKPLLRRRFDLPRLEFAFVFPDEKRLPHSVAVGDGEEIDVLLEIGDWRVEKDGNADAFFTGAWPEAGGGAVERVALSHLKRFVDVTLANLDSRVEPLPPRTGARAIVARSGAGRLEDWDGARVLFLEGTPEEMGRQHGELLREQVRSVVDRVVYGAGVGSSVVKGRWFFGEIEEACSRLEPFIDPRYLREMDAIAEAAGMEPEEIRLANFFPELFHCSGFAIHGKATADGRLYHGRVLDYLRGAGLEENAVVMVVQPDEGNAWVNVGYAGFVGSVTAMNEKRVAIGEMGGRGEGDWDGKPMAQLMREVMERADTVEEAVAIMRRGPRTCEYFYVISDAVSGRAVGVAATPEKFETVWSGETHPRLPAAVEDAVLLSADERYEELVRRVRSGHGGFDAESARDLMTPPVCMDSNIQSVLFAPETLDFWVANADSESVASEARYTHYNLGELLRPETDLAEK